MTYVQGFVVAVPTGNRQAYIDHATRAVPLFKEFGAGRMTENWGDDVPKGEVTDFRRAVQATADETVLFSWIEFADKAIAEAAGERMRSDPRMADLGEMPFDGTRMVWGGFETVIDVGSGGAMGYVDGFLIAVADDKRDAYFALARKTAPVFLENGATRVVETWGESIPDGKVTDFRRATAAQDGESIVYSWIEWPSKVARDSGMEKVMADERMQTPPAEMPFDGARMIYGGFSPILDAWTPSQEIDHG